jgi:hypothetical protein
MTWMVLEGSNGGPALFQNGDCADDAEAAGSTLPGRVAPDEPELSRNSLGKRRTPGKISWVRPAFE